MRKLNHPNIQKIVEIYEDELNVFLILEMLCGKNMKNRLNDLINIEEKSLSDIIQKLLSIVCHMHSKKVVHRDINLDNIFFKTPNNIFDICLVNFIFADHPTLRKSFSS